MVSSQKSNPNERPFGQLKLEGRQAMLFFNMQETIQYLFFNCHIARFTWLCNHFALTSLLPVLPKIFLLIG